MELYKSQSSDPKRNAQRNLEGRTHYVDDDTLRHFHSHILSSWHEADGLLFCIIESCAADMNNTQRGFRYSIFDVFGNVVSRPDIERLCSTRKKAERECAVALAQFDAKALTEKAIQHAEQHHAYEMDYLRKELAKIGK